MKTKKKDFKVFRAECEYWVDKFNLREWKIYYKHEKSTVVPDTLAWIKSNWCGRTCLIGLTPDWVNHDLVKDFELGRSAFHEVCELMLSDVGSIAQMDICPTQKDELESRLHSVIRRLEHAVWLPDWEKRKKQ